MTKYNVVSGNLVIGNSPLAISKEVETGISIEFLRLSTKQKTRVMT